MKFPALERLLSVSAFIVIAVAAFILAPYLVTAERYGKGDRVHPSFPIAVAEHGNCSIVLWDVYRKSPERYATQLVTVPDSSVFTGCATGSGSLAISMTAGNTYQLTYHADGHTFWSEYSIVDGMVSPVSFRFRGASVVIPVLFIALLGAAILHRGVRRYIARRANRARLH